MSLSSSLVEVAVSQHDVYLVQQHQRNVLPPEQATRKLPAPLGTANVSRTVLCFPSEAFAAYG